MNDAIAKNGQKAFVIKNTARGIKIPV